MACLKIPKFEPTEQKIKIFYGGLTDVEVEFNSWRSYNDIKINKIETSVKSVDFILTVLYTQVVKTKNPQDIDCDLYRIIEGF